MECSDQDGMEEVPCIHLYQACCRVGAEVISLLCRYDSAPSIRDCEVASPMNKFYFITGINKHAHTKVYEFILESA